MADPNTPHEIPTEGEIPRSRDEKGERESEEVKEEEAEPAPPDPERVNLRPDEPEAEKLPRYDVDWPPGSDDADLDPDAP